MPVEGASQDEPQCREPGVEVPSPSEGGEAQIRDGVEAAIRRVANGSRGQLRMDEDRLAKFRCGREEVVVDRVIEEEVAGSAIDHGPDVADAGCSFKFAGDVARGRHRQRGQRSESRLLGAGCRRCNVVRGAAQPHGVLGRERLSSGRRQGEDRHVDALRVHGCDSARTEVLESLLMVTHSVEGEALVGDRHGPECGRQLRRDPVFFDCGQLHGGRPYVARVSSPTVLVAGVQPGGPVSRIASAGLFGTLIGWPRRRRATITRRATTVRLSVGGVSSPTNSRIRVRSVVVWCMCWTAFAKFVEAHPRDHIRKTNLTSRVDAKGWQ